MEFDDAIKIIGQFGKYQKAVLLTFGLCKLLNAYTTMGIVFIAGVPEHWCRTPELHHLNLTDDTIRNLTLPLVAYNGQTKHSSCSRYRHNYTAWTEDDVSEELMSDKGNVSKESCPNGWVYDNTVYTSTIVSQWDLVCDKSLLRATSSSLYMAGFMVGVLLASSVADIIGRRPTLIGCFIGAWIMSTAISFAPNYIAFCVMRFFAAACCIGYITSGFVIMMEFVGPDYRAVVGVGTMGFWSLGLMIYAVFAYYIRDWYTLNLTTSATLLPSCFLVFFIPESPRWLYLSGQKEKGDAIIRRAAKFNGVTLPDNLDIRVQVTSKGYFWDLWRTRRIAFKSAILCYIWLVCSCVYYGLSLNTSNLGGNNFVNFFISGGIELPSYILCQVAFHYIGTRWPQCVSLVLSGIPLLCIMAVPTDLQWVTVTLAMVGKFAITAAFGIIYVFSAEIYPTVVRNIGVGCGSFSARIGGVLAPLINELNVYSRLIPLVIFGVMSMSAGLLALTLPETKGARLPETLQDAENFGREKPKNRDGQVNDTFVMDTMSTENGEILTEKF